MKKLISLLLILVLLFSITANSVCAAGFDNLSIETVTTSINAVTRAVNNRNLPNASGITAAFNTMFSVGTKISTVLGIVNGSVAFLKLIGVMKDPTEQALAHIQDQLNTIDEKLTVMDEKLNNITGMLTEILASTQFNNRAETASDMRKNWRGFADDHMENGMDMLMEHYSAMEAGGLYDWCVNDDASDRNKNGVDNRSITVVYLPDKDGKDAPAYFIGNEVPEEYINEKYFTFKESVLPQNVKWDADNYFENMVNAVTATVTDALNRGDYSGFDSNRMTIFMPEGRAFITEAKIRAAVIDAVNGIVFRVGASEINGDRLFAADVKREFRNYCTHLSAPEDGIDAMLQATYLSHSFEYEVKDQLEEFCDQMLIKTGVYGVFAADVLGKSLTATSADKLGAMDAMCKAVDSIETAQANCLTGYDNFCYITNSLVEYANISFNATATVNTSEWESPLASYKRFDSANISAINVSLPNDKAPSPMDETHLKLLMYVLQTGGVSGSYHDYFSQHISGNYGTITDTGRIVTSFTGEKTMPKDGSTPLLCRKVIGDWFTTGSIYKLNALPGDPENQYILSPKYITGTYLTTDTGVINAEQPLFAAAVYGEHHSGWFWDECCLLGGPGNYKHFGSAYTRENKGNDKYLYTAAFTALYNTVNCKPLPEKLSSGTGYDPLESFGKIFASLNAQYKNEDLPQSPDTGDAVFIPAAFMLVCALSLTIIIKKKYVI